MITTGQCSTCQNLFCETPKVRKTHPQLGCPQWTTEEAAKLGQYRKTHEEVGEILEAIDLDDVDLAKDAIGDTYVTLVLQAERWGLTMAECIDQAWNEIKDRKGRMVNGIFVKEAS